MTAAAVRRYRPPAVTAAAVRRHWPLAVVLLAGAALRAVVMLAYVPLFWFTDTGRYLRFAKLGRPDTIRPWGYSGFLRVVLHVLSERGVVALQHALMLAGAGVLYAFLVRRGVARWVSALAVAPLALSPLVVNVEHHLLSDSLFVILFSAAALLLSWSDARPRVWACALAGLSLAAATVTREVALVMVVPAVVYLLARRAGAARLAAFLVPAAVPVLAYVLWVHAAYGVYGLSTWSGKMLYARVAPIARCDRLGRLTAQQRELCDPRPPGLRPGPGAYLWTHGKGPQRHLPDRVVLSFARRVITHQPLAYAQTVARQAIEAFSPGFAQRRGEACAAYWTYPDPLPGGCRTDAVGTRIWRRHPFAVERPLADGLSGYQRLNDAAGPVMLACLVTIGLGLSRRGRRSRLRLDAVWLAAIGLILTLTAFATSDFSYRYTLPLYPTLPVAAALAVTQIARGRAP